MEEENADKILIDFLMVTSKPGCKNIDSDYPDSKQNTIVECPRTILR